MSDRPLKTLPCVEKYLELYPDKIILRWKGGIFRQTEMDETLLLNDIAQVTHLDEQSFRANCYNLIIKDVNGRLFVLSYDKKYRQAADFIFAYVRNTMLAVA